MDPQASDKNNEKPAKRSLFDRFRRSSEDSQTGAGEQADQTPMPKKSIAQRMRSALSRTGDGLTSLFLGSKVIDGEILEQLETALIMADVGIETTASVLAELTAQLNRQELKDGDALRRALQKILVAKLERCQGSIDFDITEKPFVLFVVGVNGVGKTTTIGKLASRLKVDGKNVMLAAGDTFRAAAVEQLQVWGQRNEVVVIAQHTGADSASVIFDGIQAAKSRGADILIADTAGRLHNKSNLMEELKKVKRVAGKIDQSAPHEVLLVLDAGTGQNAVVQMAEFDQVVGVTGIALTKLDGSAKGGIVFALADKFSVPIRYIGVGEGQDDLQPFDADQFVSALLGLEK